MPADNLFKNSLTFLAPLAGLTDYPFRGIAKKFGVDITVSEMISANALIHQNKKSFKMINPHPLEKPYSLQIAADSPKSAKEAIEILNDIEGIDIIDLNCGCPAPKVVKSNQGSALLKDLKLMGEIIETIKKYSNKKYLSVKSRLGFNEKNHIEIAKVCEGSGADFIAIHGRTRAGRFKAPVDYDAIGEVKSSVKIPVIANGDITTYQKAKWVLEHTKCDGVMIGRGAIGKPWIFKEIKEEKEINPKEFILEIVLEHLDEMINFYGEYGIFLFRKHLHEYSKSLNLRGAAQFRNMVNRIDNIDELKDTIIQFFPKN
ncbi:MAG: tRNA-dihydrouridine synthase [Epsilonproteobacteria bacterium]|nr:tRNA-dihydrouridine synthase [Campylobacterota bacterium]